VWGQQVRPDTLPLSQQFRMHYFIDDSIVAALPGYVDFDSDPPCYMVVHLSDTLHWADSARALFQHALPADTSELAQTYCAGHPEVRVRATRYTRAQLTSFVKQMDSVLAEPALRVRGGAWFAGETLIVSVPSRAALERARTRLAREAGIPQSMITYRVWVPEEVDGPVSPPRSAYLAVLDTIAAAPPERSRRFVIDPQSLPATVSAGDLRRRGLRMRSPSDTCNPVTADSLGVTVVLFREPRQYVNGAYAFYVSWRLNDYYYRVRCESGRCRITDSGQLPGDKISVGCVRIEFGRGRTGALPRTTKD
jgi:hypothetical protein